MGGWVKIAVTTKSQAPHLQKNLCFAGLRGDALKLSRCLPDGIEWVGGGGGGVGLGMEVLSDINSLGFDHINRNAPVLIRTPKLTRFEPA